MSTASAYSRGLFQTGCALGVAPFRGVRAVGARPWELSPAEFFAGCRLTTEAENLSLRLAELQIDTEPAEVLADGTEIRLSRATDEPAALAYHAGAVVASHAPLPGRARHYATYVDPRWRRRGLGFALCRATYWHVRTTYTPGSVTPASIPMVLSAHWATVLRARRELGAATITRIDDSAAAAEHAELLAWASTVRAATAARETDNTQRSEP
jgi:GNAT superfamily N-acetyltransferase